MRVPIPLVLTLCLLVIGGTWWNGTRKLDFLKPPADAKLSEVRMKVRASLPHEAVPAQETLATPVSNEPAPPVEEAKPSIELGDLESPPNLGEYENLTEKGAPHLIELAVLLETEGELQRSLLAWERVLDSVKPDATQTTAAITAIKRLRPKLPDWNTEPSKAVTITLQAGAAKKATKALTPILEEIAKELEHSSAGILKVSVKLTPGRDPKGSTAPAPVAIWLTGGGKDTRSTEVLSFTTNTPESLGDDLRKTTFQLIRAYMSHALNESTPPPAANGEAFADALGSHITRRQWKTMGTVLNYPMDKPQPAKPQTPKKTD